jgi:twinkle protein
LGFIAAESEKGTNADGHPFSQALAEELARRLGRDRCWRVRWPAAAASEAAQQQQQPPAGSADASPSEGSGAARKDANEVLLKDGRRALQDLIQSAEPYPIRGLFKCAVALSPRAACLLAVNSCKP